MGEVKSPSLVGLPAGNAREAGTVYRDTYYGPDYGERVIEDFIAGAEWAAAQPVSEAAVDAGELAYSRGPHNNVAHHRENLRAAIEAARRADMEGEKNG